LGAKGYMLGIFINIKEAFDSTSNKFIKEAMTKRKKHSWTGHRTC